MVLSACTKKDESESNSTNTETTPQSNLPLQPVASPAQELLSDISGVWSDGNTLVYFYPHDNKFQLMVDDVPKVANIGDIDVAEGTVNIIVVRNDNNQKAIWTVKKEINSTDSSYTLLLTFHDGSDTELSFVRSIGQDDINHLSDVYSQNKIGQSTSVTQGAQAVASAGHTPAPTPVVETAQPPVVAGSDCESKKMSLYNTRYETWKTQQANPPSDADDSKAKQLAALAVTKSCAREKETFLTGKPSFNCDKASTFVEHQICSSPNLALLDVRLSAANSSAQFFAYDKVTFAQSGVEWRAKRDACKDVSCITAVYNDRIAELNKQ